MPIAHDTTTNAAAYSLTGTQTTSHAANASARAAVVLIEQDASTTDQVTTVTYGGVTMTRLGSDIDSTEPGRVYIYFLDGISGGTQNVAMTTSGTSTKYLSVSTMTVSINPSKISVGGSGYTTANSASASNPALTLSGLTAGVTYVAYEVIHSGLQTMTTTPQTTPAWTLIQAIDLGTTGFGMARIVNAPVGTTLTAGWIAATADDYVISGVAFYEDLSQTLNSIAIDTGDIFGTPTLTVGPVTLNPLSIISEESHGQPTISYNNVMSASGISSQESVSTPTILPKVTLQGVGIATGETVGTPIANVIQNLNTAGGISSAQAFGTPQTSTSTTLSSAGNINTFAIGTPSLNALQNLNNAGAISSAATVPSPITTTQTTLNAVGINDSIIGIVGTPTLSTTTQLNSTGIVTAQAFGTPNMTVVEESWGFMQLS